MHLLCYDVNDRKTKINLQKKLAQARQELGYFFFCWLSTNF